MNTIRHQALPLVLLLGLFFVPWFLMQCFQVTNLDSVWLTKCAERLIGGMKMRDGCFVPNPPLCILLYWIPAVLEKYAGIPLGLTIPLFDFVVLGLSVFAAEDIVKRLNIISDIERYVLLFAFVAANTLLTGDGFGEKDQIVVLGLFPMVLMQYGLTRGIQFPAGFKWTVLILGSIATLIKPHYGLIPAAMLIHRVLERRRWNIIRDPDFIALAGCALAYAAILLIWFRDFLTVILPLALRLYVLPSFEGGHSVWLAALIPAGFISCMLPLLFIGAKRGLSELPFLLMVCAALSLVVFILQNKGFAYHIFPTTGFAFAAVAIPLMRLFGGRPGFKACMLLASAAFVSVPLNLATPHRKDIEEFPVTKEVNLDIPGCSFFMFSDIINIMNVWQYTHCDMASRFIYLWWLHPLLREKLDYQVVKTPALPEQETDKLARTFAHMLTEDFQRWKPDVVVEPTMDHDFDFAGFFSSIDPEFAALWKNDYVYSKDITASAPQYFVGRHPEEREKPLHYIVYRRKDSL
ncbi:MAG TPA: hypothetical protein VL625_06510 [Patescibacteria group bacterium]|nr:hypothetical protein [Patescibacteria group bacterium]